MDTGYAIRCGGFIMTERCDAMLGGNVSREASSIDVYIYYIHPELRIENWRSGSEKGAGLLSREH